jgi:exodeoxyribonuclease-3
MPWTLSTLNLNGMRAASRNGFAQWRQQSGADVLCLQELRMQAGQMGPEHGAPEGWSHVQADAGKKGYSGVAVWSRLPARGARTGGGLSWADQEGRIARLDLEPASVVSVYLPSGSSGPERQAMKEEFMAWFLDWSRSLLAERRPIVLCGDLNIAHTERDIHNPGANKKNSGFLPHEREWFSRLLALGWVDVWRACNPDAQEYTWWSNRGQARALDRGWRLDYQLASPQLAERAQRAWITGRTPALSDHCAVSVTYAD